VHFLFIEKENNFYEVMKLRWIISLV